MSAIWGCINFGKTKCLVDSMQSEYKRKCKLDRITEKQFGNALFGSGLQFINDIDEAENMPYVLNKDNEIITNESRIESEGVSILTADCILDNREKLIDELGIPANTTDGQVICHAFRKWGETFPSYLRGIFSVAIYNIKEESLYLCTDQFAKRCLYYLRNSETCIFSTLISPIKEIMPNLERNEQFFSDYLVAPFFMPSISAYDTPWKDIILVEPGSYIKADKNGLTRSQYYTPQKIKLPKKINDIKKLFLDIYNNSVKGCIRTNGNVSISLSGGFDSSSVAALAAGLLDRQDKKLFSYTYTPYYKEISGTFQRNQVTDETQLVELLAKKYPNICTHFHDGDGKDFIESIDNLIDILEIPYKAYINMPSLTYAYNKSAANGSKIMLCGQNGNLTVSYGNVYNSLSHLLRHHRYIEFMRYYLKFVKVINQKPKEFWSTAIDYIKNNKSDDKPILEDNPETRNPFVNEDIFNNYDFQRLALNVFITRGKLIQSEVDYHEEVYTKSIFSYIGTVETKMGLNTGIIIRDPTLCVDIINFCYSLPFELFSYNGVPRHLIRGFMSDYLPREILYPIDKAGIQNADWLMRLENRSEEVYSLLNHELLSDSLAVYTDQEKLKTFIDEKKPFDGDYASEYMFIFILYSLKKYLNAN
jgi:asparagine synthase (glutamine-hydrolysing)